MNKVNGGGYNSFLRAQLVFGSRRKCDHTATCELFHMIMCRCSRFLLSVPVTIRNPDHCMSKCIDHNHLNLQVRHVTPLQVEYIWMWFWIIDDPLRCCGIIFALLPPLQADCGNVQIQIMFEKLWKRGYETLNDWMTSTPVWYYSESAFYIQSHLELSEIICSNFWITNIMSKRECGPGSRPQP